MGNLFGSLEIGRQALQVNQLGLQVTSHNISNVNTPGYTRQELQLQDNYYPQTPYGSVGFGVKAQSIESYRDLFVLARIRQEMMNQGYLDTRTSGLQQIESVMTPQTGSVQESMRGLFQSFQALSADPANSALRQDVLAKADRLAGAFHRTYEQLQTYQTNMDELVSTRVKEVNDLTAKIASLNREVFEYSALPGSSSSDARDQRDEAIRQLSERIGILSYEDSRGEVTIQTEGGALLVSGGDSNQLTTGTSMTANFTRVYSGANDITDTISTGILGGILKLRDQDIAQNLTALDNLAYTVIDQVNTVHANGWGLDGSNGLPLFQPFVPPAPGDYTGAARTMAVALTNPDSVAASSLNGEAGNNVNALALVALEDTAFATSGGLSVSNYWDRTVTDLGVATQSSNSELESATASMTQLQNLRDSASGVDLDEEGVGMIKYQRAYEAMSRFMKTIDEITAELLQLR